MRQQLKVNPSQILLIVSLFFTAIVFSTETELSTVKLIQVSEELTFDGTVEAVNQGTASAQTSGRVVETYFDVGDLVEKNDLILRLENKQQTAALENAQANMKSARALSLSAEKEFLRIKDVYQKKLVSRSVFDKALAQRDSSKARLKAAIATEKNARVQLEYTKIKAPYSGIVVKRLIEVGETVSPGTPVYTGMSLEKLRILTQVPQKDIDAIRRYHQAVVELPDGNKIKVSGDKLNFFGYADPKTSSFKVRVQLPDGLAGLYPGMYLKTSFQIGEKQVLSLPQSSIIYRGEVTAVFVKNNPTSQTDDSKKYRFSQIRLGRKLTPTLIEILSGLSVDQQVVVHPQLIIQKQTLQQSDDSRESKDKGEQ